MAPPDEVELAPPGQHQLLSAPPRWGQNILQLPWQTAFVAAKRAIHVGPEALRKRSWWGQEKFARWGRNNFAESVMDGPGAWDRDQTIGRAIQIRDGVIRNPRIVSFQRRSAEFPHTPM